MKTREQREQRALGWSALVGLICIVLIGRWLGWPGAWWWYPIGFVILTGSAFNGWQRSAAQSALIEQNERQKREQDPPEGG